jgi:hypothetical protein
MSHGIWKCSCGALIAQCRCINKNKPVIIIENGCNLCKAMKTFNDKYETKVLRPDDV